VPAVIVPIMPPSAPRQPRWSGQQPAMWYQTAGITDKVGTRQEHDRCQIAYDKELPEIPGCCPWEKPTSFLVKDAATSPGRCAITRWPRWWRTGL
jgi:hypothetical protein